MKLAVLFYGILVHETVGRPYEHFSCIESRLAFAVSCPGRLSVNTPVPDIPV